MQGPQKIPPRLLVGYAAAAALIAIVVLRAIVHFTPQLWSLDDARSGAFIPGVGFRKSEIGAAGAAVTDLLAVGVLALAVIDAMLRRGRVHVGLLALWAAGFGVAMWHGSFDAESLRLGGEWAGSVAIALAAMHLAQSPAVRRVLIAAVVALAVPLAFQAVYQYAVEHPMTVAEYERTREDFLRRRGWEPGSPQARKYEERLMQREATGRFVFSNVFGSVAATLAVLGIGAAGALIVRDRRDAAGYAALAAGAAALAALALSFSKGAMLALVAACAAVACTWLVARLVGRAALWWRLAAVGIVAAGLLGVAARGLAGEPETHHGERSLLFRWHYWQAAASMTAEHPVLGVGPGRFQQQYLLHKNPLNPEDVTDPHSVFVAFIATLGLGGLAWSAILAAMIWRSGSAVVTTTQGGDGDAMPERARWWLVVAAACAAFGVAMHTEQPRMDIVTALLALAGALAFVGLAGWIGGRAALDDRIARIALFAAAMTAMLHAQIEMSLTKAMAGPVLLGVLGLAAAAAPSHDGGPMGRARRVGAIGSLAVLVVAAVVMLIVQVNPTLDRERAMQRAVTQLAGGSVDAALSQLQRARRAMPYDATLGHAEAQLLVQRADSPDLAGAPDVRERLLTAAMEALQRSRATGSVLATTEMYESLLAERAFEVTMNPAWLARALASAERRAELTPHSAAASIRAGDVAWRSGERERARERYRRALELDERAYLDPNSRLDAAERSRIERRLGG